MEGLRREGGWSGGGNEEKGEQGGTGGVAAVGSRSLSALPTCSGPSVIGYYFLIIIIFTYVMVSHR